MQNNNLFTIEDAQKKLEHYCSYQERCHKEVIQKLRELKMKPADINQIVGQLIQDNYLNETRFAKIYAQGKFRIKKWGYIRITSQLKFREISPWNIKKALEEINDEEYILCFQTLFDKLWIRYSPQGLEICKKKVISNLKYKGWEGHLIYEAIAQKLNQK